MLMLSAFYASKYAHPGSVVGLFPMMKSNSIVGKGREFGDVVPQKLFFPRSGSWRRYNDKSVLENLHCAVLFEAP